MPGSSVAVIVPVKNAARTLNDCLSSLEAQSLVPEIIVVDCGSVDNSRSIAEAHAVRLFTTEPNVSAQRNLGVAMTSAPLIGFIDADMRVDTQVVEQAVAELQAGCGSVVVPERTIGNSFWAAVRAYERSFYVGTDIEAARFFRREVFTEVGGFDETITAMEDWQLSDAAAKVAPVGRTTDWILHDEGEVRFRELCSKKANYVPGLRVYREKYGRKAQHGYLFNRPFVRRPWLLFRRPLLGVGVIALKISELAFVLRASIRESRTVREESDLGG